MAYVPEFGTISPHYIGISSNSANKAAAMVVNALISEAQSKKMNPIIWVMEPF
jgi:ABC-type uncharacterized transport system YnjBCD substrate-binding protein